MTPSGIRTLRTPVSAQNRLKAIFRRTVLENPFIPIIRPRPATQTEREKDGRPSRQQTRFLAFDGLEGFYGGAAGGGKSDALLMAALQYVEVPGYSALLLRRTLPMLKQDDGLIPRSQAWLVGTGATYHQTDHRWTFPSGAKLTFGYLDQEKHLDNYQGGAWHYVGADEAGQFPESRITYLHSRLRKPEDSKIPIRMRLASNPGGPGHEWLKKRFVTGARTGFFVPAKLAHNPGLDAKQYIRGLIKLDPIRRAQLLAGDWEAYEGGRFREKWFRHFRVWQDLEGNYWYVLSCCRHCNFDVREQCAACGRVPEGVPVNRCWNAVICDPACTEKDVDETGAPDPTTIGAYAVTPKHDLLVLKMVRKWLDIDDIPKEIQAVFEGFGAMWAGIEDNGFAIGITRACQRLGLTVKSLSPEGKGKLVRATPAIIRAENGQIFLPEKGGVSWVGDEAWCEDWVAEHIQFTGIDGMDAYDDQVDNTAYMVQELHRMGLGGPLVVDPREETAWDEDEDELTAGGLLGWER